MKYLKTFERRTVKVFVTNDSIILSDPDFRQNYNNRAYKPEDIPEVYKAQYDKLKFHVGDFVRYKSEKNEKRVYFINIIELTCITCNDYKPYLIVPTTKDTESHWTDEGSLTYMADYEVSADKYNL